LNTKPVGLKVLLQQRHMQTHSAFCREYDKVAAEVDRALKGGWPSRAQFYRWLSGDLLGLPYADHCRVLEKMFPEWKVDQLFQVHDGGIELAVSIDHGDTMLRDQLIEDLDRFLPV
jgi:hypothetical protein